MTRNHIVSISNCLNQVTVLIKMVTGISMTQDLFVSIPFYVYCGGSDLKTVASLVDNEQIRRPSIAVHNGNVSKVCTLLLGQSHFTLQIIAEKLNIGNDVFRTILTKKIIRYKIYFHFVSHFLIKIDRYVFIAVETSLKLPIV